MKQIDNLHYNFRSIDGFAKAFNFVFSPRELGKTTMCWLNKIYMPWKRDGKPWIYLVRKSVEITDALIDSIADTIINKFTDDNVQLEYTRGSFKDGIVDVKIKGKLFFRIVSLSIDLRRIKLAVLKNIGGVFMDEYIIDPRTQEKYIVNEAFKIKEAYSTWRRESDGMLKVYIVANPYSLYNPLFLDWNVDVSKLRKNEFYVGDTYVIHWATLSDELRAHLLALNPLYVFDEQYNQYAVEGTAINDQNIKLGKMPNNFSLRFVFAISGKKVGIFANDFTGDNFEDFYFCKFIDEVGARRTIYCFDFAELVERSCIFSNDEKARLSHFKNSMRRRQVVFDDISCYYLCEEIYRNL